MSSVQLTTSEPGPTPEVVCVASCSPGTGSIVKSNSHAKSSATPLTVFSTSTSAGEATFVTVQSRLRPGVATNWKPSAPGSRSLSPVQRMSPMVQPSGTSDSMRVYVEPRFKSLQVAVALPGRAELSTVRGSGVPPGSSMSSKSKAHASDGSTPSTDFVSVTSAGAAVFVNTQVTT